MLWSVFRMECDKIFKRKIFWLELSLLTLIFVLIDVVVYLDMDPRSSQMQLFTWPNALGTTLIDVTSFIGGILLIVLVGLVTAQEYTWRTMQLWLSHGVSRRSLISIKALALLIPLIGMLLASIVIGGGLSAILSLIVQESGHIEQFNFGQLLLAYMAEAYGMLPYLALTFMVAIVSRSALLGVSLSLIYMLVIERVLLTLGDLLKGSFAVVALYLPASLKQDILNPFLSGISSSGSQVVIGTTAVSSPLVNPAIAAISIGFYTFILFSIAFWAFSRDNMSN